jgi:uncharacterized protein (TIGR02099 family)
MLTTVYICSIRFEKYQRNFEQFIGNVIQQPVQIGAITIGSHGIEPILKLQNVTIFNKTKTKKIIQTNELQLGMDLIKSLLQWKFKLNFLSIHGGDLDVYQDEHCNFRISGVSSIMLKGNNNVNSILHDIISWLSEQDLIELSDLVINYRLANGQIIKITNLRLQLRNDILQHELKIHGKIKQQDSRTASIKAKLRIHGSLIHYAISPIIGEIKLDNFIFDLNKFLRKPGINSLLTNNGNINLTITNSIIISKLFRQPLLLDNWSSTFFWQRDNQDYKIEFDNLKFADKYLTFYGNSKLLFTHKSKMPTVDIGLKFKLTNITKAKLYYPITLLSSRLVSWLDQAFISSKVISGNMILQGPLDKFPFDHKEGKFIVDSIIRDVHLRYDHEWPQIDKITGKMIFANRSMTITSYNAKIMGNPTTFIKTNIPNLELPTLYVEGVINTTSSFGLKFLKSCPLNYTVGRKLQNINLTGPMKLNLKLRIPLSDNIIDKNTYFNGEIELQHNLLKVQNLNLEINEIDGYLNFKDTSLSSRQLRGKLFSKPISMMLSTIQSKNNQITRINIIGNAEIQDFERIFSINNLHSYAQGNFNYTGLLDLHDGSSDILKIETNLLGVEIKLPTPYTKKINEIAKLNLICWFKNKKSPAEVYINYNDYINAALLINKNNSHLEIMAGEIKLGTTPTKIPHQSGLIISGRINKLDWQNWKKYLINIQNSTFSTKSLLRKINLNINQLHFPNYIFNQISLMLEAQADGWLMTITAPDIDGKLYIPNNFKTAIKGYFKKVYFNGEEQKKLTTFKLKNLPPLDIKIDDFHFKKKHSGKISFITEPRDNGVKIKNITICDSEFTIVANGEWLVTSRHQSTFLHGKIKSNNIGSLLKYKDITDIIIDGNGEANFNLKWADSPYNFDLQTARGNCSFDINNGRVINLDKKTERKFGLGKILSILSLQSLPRRLTLDFSDITKKGFSFDTLNGEMELKDGDILVKNINIDGNIANIKAYGKIGLQNQNYDLKLNVIPQLTSSIPIAATIAGGPIAGAVGFIAEKLVSTAIKKTVSYDYHIIGSWNKPEINIIDPQFKSR